MILSPRVKSGSPENEWSIPSLREPRYSQSLERGLAILGCFKPEHPVLGIADDLGMSRSSWVGGEAPVSFATGGHRATAPSRVPPYAVERAA